MFTVEEIKNIIQQGENNAVEFKSATVHPDSLANEMVSFSNSQGGLIVLGVEDDGTVSGLSEGHDYETWVMNIARNNVRPAIQVSWQRFPIEGQEIALINVTRGQDKPYQTAKAKYLIRVGSTNRLATQQELLCLFQASGLFHFDATVVEGSSIRTLNLAKVDTYFRRYGVEFAQEDEASKVNLLTNSDILDEQGRVTVGGMLIFGINPTRYLPQAGIAFAHFSGDDIDDTLIDKQTIEGTLDYQIDTGVAVIKNNWLMPSQIEGIKREAIGFIFSDKVFRELLTNACVHRNYAIRGSQIRVFMFANRLEFRSPGRLPNTITIEKLKVGVSYAVNPILVKFMENLRYIERLGRGLPMVYREVTQSGRRVEFKEVGEEFWVTLWLR